MIPISKMSAVAIAVALGGLVLALSGPGTTVAQAPSLSMEDTPEVKLTEQLVLNFLSAQKATMPLQKKAMEAAQTDPKAAMSMTPDPKYLAEVEAVVKQHGFTSAQDYLNTSMTLMPMMMPLMFGAELKPPVDDSAQKKAQYEAEMADVAKDATLDDKQKAEITAKLKKSYDKIKPIAYPENFAVIEKMKDKISAAMKEAMTETMGTLFQDKKP
jgi:hypothetical protein